MNRIFYSVIRGNPLVSPNAPLMPQIPPAVGAALVAGGANLLGSIFGQQNQDSANQTNLQIAEKNAQLQRETNEQNAQLQREVNALNYRMMNEQNAFTEQMWNKTNQYNSPSAVVERLKAAGINPLFAMGNGGNASQVSSVQSGAAVAPHLDAPQVNATMRPYDPSGGFSGAANAVLQSLNWKTQADLNSSQVAYNTVKAENEKMLGMAQLANELQKARKGSVEYAILLNEMKIAQETMNDQMEIIHNTARAGNKSLIQQDLDIASRRIANDIANIDLRWRNKVNEASYNQILAGCAEAYAAARAHNESALLSAAETAVANARKSGLDIDNENARLMSKDIQEKARFEAKYAEEHARREKRYRESGVLLGNAPEMPSWDDIYNTMYNRKKSGGVR